MKIGHRFIRAWALPTLAVLSFVAFAWSQGANGYCTYEDDTCSSAGYSDNGLCSSWAAGSDYYCYCAIDYAPGGGPIVYPSDPQGDCLVGPPQEY